MNEPVKALGSNELGFSHGLADKFETDLRLSIAEKRAAIERLRQELDRDERTLAARLDVSVRELRKMIADTTIEAPTDDPMATAGPS